MDLAGGVVQLQVTNTLCEHCYEECLKLNLSSAGLSSLETPVGCNSHSCSPISQSTSIWLIISSSRSKMAVSL